MNLPQSSEVVSRLLNGDYAIRPMYEVWKYEVAVPQFVVAKNGERIGELLNEAQAFAEMNRLQRHLVPLSSPPVCPHCAGSGEYTDNAGVHDQWPCGCNGHYSGPVTITVECEWRGRPCLRAADCDFCGGKGQRVVASAHLRVLPVVPTLVAGCDMADQSESCVSCLKDGGGLWLWLPSDVPKYAWMHTSRDISHLLDLAYWGSFQYAGLLTDLRVP